MRKRLISLILAFVMLLSVLPVGAAAEETGRFVLAVFTEDQIVVEPEFISWQPGQTVREALSESDHTFEGLAEGFVYSVDGASDNFSLFYDNNGYDLNVPAAQVTVLCITSREDGYSAELLELVAALARYYDMDNGVQGYSAAKDAAAKALAGLYTADARKAAKLRSELEQAISEYENYLSGEKVTLTLDVVQGEAAPEKLHIALTSEFGTFQEADDVSELSLAPGRYDYDISDGLSCHVRGSVRVTEGAVLSAQLPEENWIAKVDLSMANGTMWVPVQTGDSKAAYCEYRIPDYCAGNLYPFITPAEGVDTSKVSCYLAGAATINANRRVWMSKQTVLSHAIPENSMEGRELVLEARKTVGDTEQYTTYTIHINRFATLAELSMWADDSIPLSIDLPRGEFMCDVDTFSQNLTVKASPLCSGVSLYLNGKAFPGEAKLTVKDGDVVRISTGSFVYDIRIRMHSPAVVTVLPPEGGQVQVFSDLDEIPATSGNEYTLIPGYPYRYITTVGGCYHTAADFTAEDGLVVRTPMPTTENALSALEVKPARAAAQYASDPETFSGENHNMTYFVGSNQTNVGLIPTLKNPADGFGMQVIYRDARYYDPTFADSRTPVSVNSGSFKVLTSALVNSGEGNVLTLRVKRTVDGVVDYQDYTLNLVRLLQLNDLSVSADDVELTMTQDSGKTGFNKEVLDYSVSIAKMQQSLDLSLQLLNDAGGNDNVFTVNVACGDWSETLDYVTEAVNVHRPVHVPLNPDSDEAVTLTITRENAVTQTYTIHLNKLPPMQAVIHTEPENAVVNLIDDATQTRIWPEDGSYTLNTNAAYSYSVTLYGYQAQQGTFVADDDHREFTISLTPAAPNTRKDLVQPGDWPSFRGNDENNGLTTARTPILAEEAVLTWANQLGEGYSSGAVGSPIIVGGAIYSYASNMIFKIDKDTGEILIAKPMDHASNFAITPPAYGEGMIFVGLSNGTIQAFDAETLDSVWIYHDSLGGQPNCPIAYADGYIYTGFWNAETRDARFVCISVTDENPAEGKEEKCVSWTHQDRGFYWAGAYVGDGYVIVTTDDGENGYSKGYGAVLSLDAATGALLDRVQATNVGDLRSNVCYDEKTDACYFTSKGGDLYRIQVAEDGTFRPGSLRRLHLDNGVNSASAPPMSTSTPVVYNGRCYIGVSGTRQFGAYSGHNMTVVDLENWEIAYTVPTQGYPQTSGLLTTAYEEDTECVYVYFFDNYTPGKLRVLRDRPGQTELDHTYSTMETYVESGVEYTLETGYVLFTPSKEQAQYAICSPIADAEGNIYFKNDSAYLMCLSSTITALQVTKQPDNRGYAVGEVFDPAGMEVTATFANGLTKDVTKYIRYSTDPLTMDDSELVLVYDLGQYSMMYQNVEDQDGVRYHVPTTMVNLTIGGHTSHTFQEIDRHDATCTEPGYVRYYCIVCGRIYDRDQDVLGHDYKEIVVPSTCTESGYTQKKCSRCGDSEILSFEKVLGHDYKERILVPTCTEGGYTERKCTRCGETTILDPVDPLGHEWTAWEQVVAPSCAAAEELERHCILCNEVERQVGAKLDCPSAAFQDVRTGTYYHDAVDYMVTMGYMNGVSATKFDLNGTLTRGQLVTILYRMAGQPDVGGLSNPFTDVSAKQYYANAVVWAYHNGVVNGVGSGRFDPNGFITREQFATILFRYSGADEVEADALSQFPDQNKTSSWARAAMNWAVTTKLINGNSSGGVVYLQPRNVATRAQAATILYRWLSR